ncbi:MAG: nucleotidyltransferase domain-containing protein [Oligoflexia bacterium]|nr:nucleotidyltransferase domain-containing protein [Oligoflexia bacterium]
MEIESIKKQIVEVLLPLKPLKIILFGSYAYGTPGLNSDLDLYIVTNDAFIPSSFSEKNRIRLKIAKKLYSVMEQVSLDLIVHTKGMYAKFLESDSMFSRTVINKGIVLYEESDN